MFNPSDLGNFYGTANYYRHAFGKLLMTDGVFFMFQDGAAWLVDVIASYQSPKLDKQTGGFQLWILKVNADKSAVVTCQRDSDTPNLVRQVIEYTDFPMSEITLYVEGEGQQRVCLLTSEH
jgi:hypothetical protein